MATDNDFPKSPSALKEEEILQKWEAGTIFKKVLAKDSPQGEFIFYEGPPTANARPGLHHLISRAFKDVVPRYKTMQGFHVRRKAGWDTHGLPVEIAVEKALGFTSKKQIEEYGVEAFNEECKKNVWTYINEWSEFTKRIGYWVDLDDAYVTYYPQYIESLWWITKEIAKQGLLYRDYKVLPWCPRCGTALSSHELAQGYEDVKDLSVYIKFKVKGEKNTYLLAWTTTPWTLPGNVALAVGEDIDYVKIQATGVAGDAGSEDLAGELFYLAKEQLDILKKNESRVFEYKVIDELKGKDLLGLEYEPLYDFLSDRKVSADEKEAWNIALEKAWKVYPANFVTTTDGTGIVHTAVMYGQDDFELGNEIGLPKYHLVDETGHFIQGTDFLAGRFVREEDEKGKPTLAVDIIEDLKKRNLFFNQESYKHSYPHCWRCHTPLIYYARTSWYIQMSKLRDELVKENEKINWIPEHIKEGRFGEWLREVKDWAISRDRYWGTPLPAWQCPECEHTEVIGSVEELLEKSRKSGNRFIVMRHGESVASSTNVVSSIRGTDVDKLTEKGKQEVVDAAHKLKGEGIEMIIASPFTRTRETVDIMAQELDIKSDDIVIDERLHEMQAGTYDGRSMYDWDLFFTGDDWYEKRPEGGESHADVRKRVAQFIFDVDTTYKDKTILVVMHGGPAQMLSAAAVRATKDLLTPHIERFNRTAEFHEIPFVPYPHNADFELDLHKPYIDEVVLPCPKCKNDMRRTPEVMDVWFDSGAMPFAQDHYPFENKEWIDKQGFPADYISEAIDQTRGWFYTLHAISVLLGRGPAFKNVVCLTHIMDAEGKKMSKSVGNVVNPWEAIAKHGVDVLRFWMFSVNQPGDAKNYDEKTISEVNNKVFTLLRNVTKFYEMYKPSGEVSADAYEGSEHVLDLWIRALLAKLVVDVTRAMDSYDMFTATRSLREFVNELSTWYVRRSRDRFKSDDVNDAAHAVATLRFVLLELSKLFAPFTPFFAEEIYESASGTKESVHLEEWSQAEKVRHADDLLAHMTEVRRIVTLALEARTNAGIKVRQPLAKLSVRNPKSELRKEDGLLALIKDEVNVKEVVFDDSEGWEVELDTNITPLLKEEGDVRELIRALQDFRKQSGLTPSQKVSVTIQTTAEGKALIEKYMADIVSAATLEKVTSTEDLPVDQTVPVITLL
jgi:isoleucyl-tRNA synthetase